jgi:predicted DNA-binding protein
MKRATTTKRDKQINEALGGSLADVLAGGSDAASSTPDTATPMVSRSLRLPLDTYQRLVDAAAARQLPITTLMRDLIEAGLAELDDTATVPLADVRRALAALAVRAA